MVHLLNMKNKFKKSLIFAAIVIVFFSIGCFSTPEKKKAKADQKIEAAAKKIEINDNQLEERGKSLVYGAAISIARETNRTPAVEITSKYIGLSQLTLGNPSVKDADIIRGITDDLFFQYNLKVAVKDDEIKEAKAKIAEGERKLAEFTQTIIELENSRDSLNKDYQSKLDAANKVNEKNAELAQKYNEIYGGINWLNPFAGLGHILKRLVFMGLGIGLIVILFKVAEIFYPALNIVGFVFGGIGKAVIKFAPRTKEFMGVVSSKVYDSFKATVKGLEQVKESLKKEDIESSLLAAFPADHLFEKKDVLELLQKHSEQILTIIKNNMDKNHDETTRAVVNYAKSDLGLEPVAKKVEI